MPSANESAAIARLAWSRAASDAVASIVVRMPISPETTITADASSTATGRGGLTGPVGSARQARRRDAALPPLALALAHGAGSRAMT